MSRSAELLKCGRADPALKEHSLTLAQGSVFSLAARRAWLSDWGPRLRLHGAREAYHRFGCHDVCEALSACERTPGLELDRVTDHGLQQRSLEMDPGSVPGLCERFGVTHPLA